jgi:tetratricopeptide (TPR) repeat protein
MGRHFLVNQHTHLENGREREILPWLKLSAELDPQRIETYVVTAYWLADRLHKPKEAEEFLRLGLSANPNSYEILFELGKIYHKHLHQDERARGVWVLALRRWNEVEAGKEKPDNVGRARILVFLGELEKSHGHYAEAIRYLEEAKRYSPDPAALDDRIKELWLKFTLPPTSP